MTVSIDMAELDALGDDDSVSSIGKAVRVLRSLAQAGEDADGVTHIAAVAKLPKSTTHRILSVFIDEGLVCRHGSLYRLGSGWFELRSALYSPEWQRVVTQARRPLARLFEKTEATVHLGMLEGDHVVYLEKLTARGGTNIATRVGDRKPALCTAIGKAIVAQSDPEGIRAILSRPLPLQSRKSIRGAGILRSQLSEARETGLAYDFEEAQLGVFCVAAPIFRDGAAIAAVSVSRLGNPAISRTDGIAVRQAAQEISRWVAASD